MNFFGQLQTGALLLAIIVPAWWLGASTPGGQWALLAFSAVSWVSGGLARRMERRGAEDDAGAAQLDLTRAGKWCVVVAALFLGWVGIQALNPSHGLVPAIGQGVTSVGGMPAELAERSHRAWLPSGLATPFARVPGDAMPHGNAWRQLLIFGGVLMLGLALVRAVDRAGRAKRLLEWGAVQAAAFSALALAYNLSGSTLTYWKFYDPVYRLGGPQFPHDNQQVAYQLLLLAVALAACVARGKIAPFAGWAGRRGWLMAGALIVYAGTVTCRPRSGLLLGTGLVAGVLILKGWRAGAMQRRRVAGIAAAGVIVLALALVTVKPLREITARFGEFLGHPAAVFTGGDFRPLQHKVAWLMIEERPWMGWGGGSYLYLSPEYARRVPELMEALRLQGQNHWPVFPHADGDWLEFLVEYGVIGTALLVSPLVAWLWWLLPRIRRMGTAPLVLAGGVGLVLAQATIDPVLRNPAVLGTLVVAGWLAVVASSRLANE